MSDLLTDLDLKTERATEPPKRWRNWSRSLGTGVYVCLCGARITVINGECVPTHCRTHPSKDVAESVAAEEMKHPLRAVQWVYLGAYPEGARP